MKPVILGKTPWDDWGEQMTVEWKYEPVFDEELPIDEQDNNRIDFKPKYKPWAQRKMPTLFCKESLAKIRRQNLEVIE